MDELAQLLAPKFDNRLRSHIKNIDLSSISRIPASRIQETALPNIGSIELVSSDAFATSYDELYKSNFHGGERERSDLIVTRLQDDANGLREHLAPYRIIGIRDPAGHVAGGAQFSVLFLEDGRHAVPYLQYIYVRPENRRQDLSELMHTLTLAVAMADAAKRGGGSENIIVPFTLFETEPPVHGANDDKRATAAERTKIHSKSGSVALMLRRPVDNRILSTHVQPGLETGEPPLTYVWALRANPAVALELHDDQMGKAVVAAYYQSLRDEGFPEENIALAERMVEARYRGSEFCLMPLGYVTKEMYVNIDGTP
ncbi:hypothetical protein PRZ48_001475 [Zasmidium cellare]|uniref:Uncharacterized protein n=1 Tax=Zasmidium cellare TaxID=395010 RepID=A0ABR0F220_ZASCE|nr:hypothetical protein PRZ48_001475 [Zasmidium cellare]